MFFKRFYNSDLAQASYLIGCQNTGDALVIDADRNIQPYLATAAQEGLRIRYVTETHIHADYLSGSQELAAHTQAELYLSDEGDQDWQYSVPHNSLKEGVRLQIGKLSLETLHTPGHTPEHVSFVLRDHSRSDEPLMLFSGDWAFVGDIGRPDLLDLAAGYQDSRFVGAEQLFNSLKKHFLTLPDHVQIWPGHGAGSACGKALGALASSTIGYEKRSAWWVPYLQNNDLSGFSTALLQDQPEAPSYFARMKRDNKNALPILGTVAPLAQLSAQQAEQYLLNGAQLLDTRPRADFQAASLPKAIHLPQGSTFITWASWILEPQQSYLLLSTNADTAEQLRRALWAIGIDQVVGYIDHTFDWLLETPTLIQEPPSVPFQLLDVRTSNEFALGALPNAQHYPASQTLHWASNLKHPEQLMVSYCQAGARSAVIASYLRSRGYQVVEVAGGYAAMSQQAAQQCVGAC